MSKTPKILLLIALYESEESNMYPGWRMIAGLDETTIPQFREAVQERRAERFSGSFDLSVARGEFHWNPQVLRLGIETEEEKK